MSNKYQTIREIYIDLYIRNKAMVRANKKEKPEDFPIIKVNGKRLMQLSRLNFLRRKEMTICQYISYQITNTEHLQKILFV
ncbi:MAG: hypothetical protein [Bacteriophage sp.]|nr:MAG: hypothetical protein [Bacteriophage sp.]